MPDLSFGQPKLNEYTPALTVRDVKSPNSRSKRVMGYKTGRVHHFLSDYESGYFYLLEWSEEHDVELEFIQLGKPFQNSYIERFNRTYRNEILDFYVFDSLSDVRAKTGAWIDEYNNERSHESLNN